MGHYIFPEERESKIYVASYFTGKDAFFDQPFPIRIEFICLHIQKSTDIRRKREMCGLLFFIIFTVVYCLHRYFTVVYCFFSRKYFCICQLKNPAEGL